MEQWFLRITAYRNQLLEDMAQLAAWPERVLVQQKNWVGSRRARDDFRSRASRHPRLHDPGRHDLRATFMVLAPEHPRVDVLIAGFPTPRAPGRDRKPAGAGPPGPARGPGREGRRLHRPATPQPFTGEKIRSGRQLRAHGLRHGRDHVRPRPRQRDFEFARKYGIEVRVVIQPDGRSSTGPRWSGVRRAGPVVNSGEFDGLARTTPSEDGRPRGGEGLGKATVTYRLKDWLISRQRYWGTPIPVVYCEKDGMQPVPEAQLRSSSRRRAVHGEGGNPLEKVPASSTPPARGVREGAPRDGHHGHLRRFVVVLLPVLSPRKDDGPFDPAAVAYWFPIDLYVGGIEHAILHSSTRASGRRRCATSASSPSTSRSGGSSRKGWCTRTARSCRSRRGTPSPRRRDRALRGRHPAVYILFAAPPELAMDWSETGIEGRTGS